MTTRISDEERGAFFREIDQACRSAAWAALATVKNGEPRVRLVHPTWEASAGVVWFATDPASPKAAQIKAQPVVDLQWQVSPPDFIHVLVRGRAQLMHDDETRKHVWDTLDYDLADFWPDGPTAKNYVAVRIEPVRVEHSKMFGSQDQRVWGR